MAQGFSEPDSASHCQPSLLLPATSFLIAFWLLIFLNSQFFLVGVGAAAFIVAAMAIPTSIIREIQRSIWIIMLISGMVLGASKVGFSPLGSPIVSAIAGLLLFSGLMATLGSLVPAFRRRREVLDEFREVIESGGGDVTRTRLLVMPVKGLDERTGLFYELRTTYGDRSGTWYVCETQYGPSWWVWKDGEGRKVLPCDMPRAKLGNSVVVISGAWAVAAVVALIAIVGGILFLVAWASRTRT